MYRAQYTAIDSFREVVDYAQSIIDGVKVANKEQIQGCERFFRDLQSDRYELNFREAVWSIGLIESTFIHIKGSLKGQCFKMESWQKYIIYNIIGLYNKGSHIRKYSETFIYLPRKNAKTFFVSAVAWVLSILESKYGANLYIVATKLRSAMEAWTNIKENIEHIGERDNFKILDNNAEHSISRKFYDDRGKVVGSINIEALAQDAKRADGLNGNLLIMDELHGLKNPNEYFVYKQAMKAYERKLLLGITTAGADMNSFCYQRLSYCQKVLNQQVEDETYFIFIAKADESKEGIDYTNPIEWEKANPNFGVTIKYEDMENEASQALNDPSSRNEFLNKSLNIYTNAASAWFDMGEVQYSDEQYDWTIEELSKLKIDWYGGADLSVRHDLTAGVIYGRYQDVDITITHGFMPITQAKAKAEEDNIPFFYWEENKWLTLCNSDTVNHSDIVRWFINMRNMGFNIKNVGFDKYKSREFEREMKEAKFKIVPINQQYWMKSEAFREIERKIKERKFYYVHSKAFEYCIGNVMGRTDAEDRVRFEKVHKNSRIDLFDASVIACKSLIMALDKKKFNKALFDKQM